MLALIEHNVVPLAVSLGIGLATGWWMFRGDKGKRGSRR